MFWLTVVADIFTQLSPIPQKKILMPLNVLQFSKFYMPSKVVTKETPAHFLPVNFSNLLDHLSIEVICPTICYNPVNGLILKAFSSSSYLGRVLFLGDLWNIKRDNNAKISKVSYLQKSSFSIVPKVLNLRNKWIFYNEKGEMYCTRHFQIQI